MLSVQHIVSFWLLLLLFPLGCISVCFSMPVCISFFSISSLSSFVHSNCPLLYLSIFCYFYQEMIRAMKEKRLPAAFKCYFNFHKADTMTNDNLYYKMVIHVHSDSAFRRYQKEMRSKIFSWKEFYYFVLGHLRCI